MEDDDNVLWSVTTEDSGEIEYDPTDFKITFGLDYNDSTYGVVPEENNPELYTSFTQREKHSKYPALQKLWEDYIKLYNLTEGDPPDVER